MKILAFVVLIFALAGCESQPDKKLDNLISMPGTDFESNKNYCIEYAVQFSHNYDYGVEMFYKCMESKGHFRGSAENISRLQQSKQSNQLGATTLNQGYCNWVYAESENKLGQLLPIVERCLNDRGFTAAKECNKAADRQADWSPYAKETAKCVRAGYAEPPGSMIYKLGRYKSMVDTITARLKEENEGR